MALTVETGSGLATADAYVTVAFVDAYAAAYMTGTLATAWAAASTANKEIAIRRATQYLDAEFQFAGTRYSGTQALEFPQNDIYFGPHLQPVSPLPTILQQACAELSVRGLSDNTLSDDLDTSGTVKEYSVEIDGIKEKTVYSGGSSQQKTYTLVRNMLKPLLSEGRVFRA